MLPNWNNYRTGNYKALCIYRVTMQLTKKLLFAPPVVLVLLTAVSVAQIQSVYAWDGGGGGYFYPQPGPYSNGYSAGIADAAYDHDNNLQYNPVGQCLPCHSSLYWNGFRQGYDNQWNTYTSQDQQQKSTQGATINIYGNNYGTASIGQSNTQGQSALSGLPHLIGQGLCNLGITQSCGGGGSGP
jgi:hypothetical protein